MSEQLSDEEIDFGYFQDGANKIAEHFHNFVCVAMNAEGKVAILGTNPTIVRMMLNEALDIIE